MTRLTDQVIDTPKLLKQVDSPEVGAVVLFLGTTRGVTEGRQTVSLEYECYAEMADEKLAALEVEALQRWPIVSCAVLHRLGRLDVGEVSVAVAVSSAHRAAAFAAGQWLIDTIKEIVPIWKKENWADGTSDWVHPGLDQKVESHGER
ncbi:MAG: molybdenum cofactor biosynthesis protein MoaE [Pirellulales bacterium]|nr:molybdenum cofactor biosynthesis protein MoaE [Pirellulales bacterium]